MERSEVEALTVARTNDVANPIDQASSPPQETKVDPFSNFLVRLWVPKSKEELISIKRGNCTPYQDHPRTAASVIFWSSVMFIIYTAILTYVGIVWNFDPLEPGFNPLIAGSMWFAYKFWQTMKRISNQMYFVREEVQWRKAIVAAATARQPDAGPSHTSHNSNHAFTKQRRSRCFGVWHTSEATKANR
jgi:hypothetical protein